MKNFVFTIIITILVTGSCSRTPSVNNNDIGKFTSYMDIPGITDDEIKAIKTIKEQANGRTFIYGMPINTEAFEDENKDIRGFSVSVCNWLTELFGLSFEVALYEWQDLINGFNAGEISFTGELTATPARRNIYHMTSAIASRPVMGFRIKDSMPLAEISNTRLIRCGFMEGAATISAVTSELMPNTFEIVTINDFTQTYDALKSGYFDVFYYSGVAELSFIEHHDIVATDFYPLIYMPVSLSTSDPELKPIINTVEKILENGGLHYLTALYNDTHQEYLKYKLYMRLSDEERSYIKNNPIIKIGVDPGNYPNCFYDRRNNRWSGISMDILDEVSALSGINFQRANDENIVWAEILQMLSSGEVAILPELAETPERAEQYIWSNTSQMTDYYSLISRTEHPDIKINEVLYKKVGLAKDTVFETVFKKWFPDHINTFEYESNDEAFNALHRGEIEMVMTYQKRLLYLTHYLEMPNYKINFIFDYPINVKFGFNKNETILRSIIDKSLELIDSKAISESWMRRTYDYRRKVMEAQRPWFIGSSFLFLSVLALVAILFARSRHTEKYLQLLVSNRTNELAMQTAQMAFSIEYAKKLSDALARTTKSPTLFAGNLKASAGVIAQEGCKALNANCVGIWSYIESDNMLENICYYDLNAGDFILQGSYALTERKEYLKLLKNERLIVMNDISECKLISTLFYEYYNDMCAALDAPIRVDGKVVGVVSVEQRSCKEYQEKREWAIEEQNFASSLADLMALAISGSERRKALDSAKTASQTKSIFLANMSHEIRTPMNAILGVTEILFQHESLPAEIEEGLDKIYGSCDLLLGIINDILDFSKIEAGKLDIMPAQYKVASLINDSVHLNMMRIDSKPIEFELQIDENIPAKLVGDELRIKQVLNNLLSNAFKYTNAGKVTLSVSHEAIPLISYLPDHSMSNQVLYSGHEGKGITLVLKIQDTGIGMTADQLNEMFQEYSRFSQDKNISVEGTGLGMTITRRLVNLMDGVLHVESEPDAGTLFVVRLPQEIVDDEIIGNEVASNLRLFRQNYIKQRKRAPQIVRDPMPYGNILIVDDIETNLYVAIGLMKLYQLKIDTAMSGQEAINLVKEGKVYDAIFMDHMMPEMDGIETTKLIREWEAEQNYSTSFAKGETRNTIVALTANAVSGQSDMFLNNGFDDFISKPIDIRQLDAILNKYVRDKQPPEVIEALRNKKSKTDTLLLESFIRDARKTIQWLDEQQQNNADFNNENILKKYTIMVHGMKSSLWNIGESALSDMAYKLEMSAKEKNIDIITASTNEFKNSLLSLLEKLELNINQHNKEHDDIEYLSDKLMAIQELAASYDRKGALNIITEIKNCSKETKAALEKITEFITHSEFEEAENAAAEHAAALAFSSNEFGRKLLEKKIDGLNIVKGLTRYNFDDKTYLKVLRSYAASLKSMLSVIEKPDKESLDDYKIKVHGIKGTSLDIFAEQIGAGAKALEEASKTGNLDFINEHNGAFLEITQKMITDIEDWLNLLEAENPKEKKDKPDKKELLKLQSACKDYNMDGADRAMEELEKYQYESDDGLVNWLRESIDRMDFKQIIEKLGGII